MYRHLLVALDATPLATHTVTRSVAFARALGARITFFHAMADYGSTSEGALHHAMDPASYAEAALGRTNAILSKAATAAEAAGVWCDVLATTSANPPRAIVDAAHRRGCDLIFVCSHGVPRGVRGWFHSGNTPKLVQISDLPVHVASVEANEQDADANRALAVINGEHRSIATAVRGMEQLVRQARAQGDKLDLPLMRLIADYMNAFPEALHHPKEETQLFRLLLLRVPGMEETLTELRRQHLVERQLMDALVSAIDRYEKAEPGSMERVADAVRSLAGAIWEHMGLEESRVLPVARKHLTPADWKEIAEAFAANAEPLEHGEAPLESLFTRIANRLPLAAH
jgi:hemerythrin-like domain-containing protein/nucleotide-binding universal stress UspA family protein